MLTTILIICLVLSAKTELARKLQFLNKSIYVRSLVAIHYGAKMQIKIMLKIHFNSKQVNKYIAKY